jgi:hypothetical protein
MIPFGMFSMMPSLPSHNGCNLYGHMIQMQAGYQIAQGGAGFGGELHRRHSFGVGKSSQVRP